MARSRNIKPGFFTNDSLAEIHPLGRILFAGLWTIADREGRLEDRSKKIKAQVLPYDDCNVSDLLNDLHSRGFIVRYAVGSENYIQIVNWDKHQQPHVKETNSLIPAPDEHGASTVQIPDRTDTKTPDSLNLIPDSVNPIKRTSPKPKASTKVAKATTEPNMEELYGVLAELAKAADLPEEVWDHARAKAAYWKIVGNWHPTKNPKPKGTLLAIIESVKAGACIYDIYNGATAYKEENYNREQFMAQVSEWIKNEGWNPYTRRAS